LLEIRNLRVTYVTSIHGKKIYTTALRSVSLKVSEGETVSVVGPTKSGKTTLMKSIIRALPDNTIVNGEIIFHGENILKIPYEEFRWYRWKKIAVVFESGSYLHPGMTVLEQLLEILQEHSKVPKEHAVEMIFDVLREVGLSRYDALKVSSELSEGMKRRVLIAMAILLKPDLIIADNPIANIDYALAVQIMNLFKRFKRIYGFSLLMLLDDIRWALEFADKIVTLLGGVSLECAPTDEIYENPWHPFSKLLIYVARNPFKFIQYSVSESGCPFSPSCPYATPQCFRELPNQYVCGEHEIRCHRYDYVKEISIEDFFEDMKSKQF